MFLFITLIMKLFVAILKKKNCFCKYYVSYIYQQQYYLLNGINVAFK